ncbi:MAG: hypothetical protein IJZ88_06660 [Clostridia bacterium]|nr:hypothetical protein [Clostridia bacterium]
MNKKIKRIISLLLVAVMALSFCACGEIEEEVVKRASAVPQTKAEIFDYFCKALDKVVEEKPAVSYGLSNDAGSADCENSNIEAAFPTIAKLMTVGDGAETAYGEDCSAIFPNNKLELNDIKSANIIDIDDTTSRSYTIVMTIWDENNPNQDDSVFGKIYKISKDEDILAEMKKASAYFTVESYDAEYQIGTIRAVISKETDRLESLQLERNVEVSTEITGQNTFAEVGTVPLSFNYSSTESYDINWDDPNATKAE